MALQRRAATGHYFKQCACACSSEHGAGSMPVFSGWLQKCRNMSVLVIVLFMASMGTGETKHLHAQGRRGRARRASGWFAACLRERKAGLGPEVAGQVAGESYGQG